MRILVASGNIFRRELTSYEIGEAGYAVAEASDLPGLLEALSAGAPLAIVIDALLGGAEPGPTLQAVRGRSQAPILWMAEPALARQLLLVDARPADALAWPYQPDELRTRLTLLIGRAAAERAAPARVRSVGSAE